MILLNQLLGILWMAFIAYWIISGLQAKKTVKNIHWWKGATVRIAVVVVIILLFQTNAFQQFSLRYDAAPHELLGSIGILLCVLGLSFAVWARIHLGKNWGMPMSLKEKPELVTTGPYAYVRHPIYTGVLVASLGSALVDGPWWFIFLIFFAVYFTYSARTEEKIMSKEFPDAYPAYMKRTKMLIPFIF